MHELMLQAGVKGMSKRSKLIPCTYYTFTCTSENAAALTKENAAALMLTLLLLCSK